MITAVSITLVLAVVAYTMFIRPQDLPAPPAENPFRHLDERKARIYENLRDLQFEFRLGKLSGDDYQRTKQGLQKELATVLAETDELRSRLGVVTQSKAPAPRAAAAKTTPRETCPHCGATFKQALKFCGDCGKPMKGGAA